MVGLTAVFRCRACGAPLTAPLLPLADPSALNPKDGEPYLPQGNYTVTQGEYGPAGEFVVHLGDLVNVGHHPEPRRRNGCCGMDGCDGMNRVCPEGHEVATERSDCWMAHAAWLDPAAAFPDTDAAGFDPSWLSWNRGAVVGLAKNIARGRTFRLLPVLADALEDAGCADPHLLGHLRRGLPHRAGCWVTVLLLSTRKAP